MKRTLTPFIVVALIWTSCTKYAYYQSPFHNNTNLYKDIPLKSSNIKSATYASGTISIAGVNDQWSDDVTAFYGSVHRSHNFASFQAYYGGWGGLGNYRQRSRGISENNENFNSDLIGSLSGNKFFGGYGLNSGIGAVQPWVRGGEWRIIALGINWANEYGGYLNFRNKLPDTAANVIDRNKSSLIISISTDLVSKTRYGKAGYQFAININPRGIDYYDVNRRKSKYNSYYASHTLHFTNDKFTAILQLTKGTHSVGMSFGANYQLGK